MFHYYYVPPSADAETVGDFISSTRTKLQTKYPNAFTVIAGDFNHISLSDTLPDFHQIVNCPTRDNKTQDRIRIRFIGMCAYKQGI